MPPCHAHSACPALTWASCTLSWPHLHMAWGHACWQWLGMTPLHVDECGMKERGTAHTKREPPICPAFCKMPPKTPEFSHVPPSQGPYPKINSSKPIINSPTPIQSLLTRLHVSSMCAGFKRYIIYNAYMMHTAQGAHHASTEVGAPKPHALPSSKPTQADVRWLGSLVLCMQPCLG